MVILTIFNLNCQTQVLGSGPPLLSLIFKAMPSSFMVIMAMSLGTIKAILYLFAVLVALQRESERGVFFLIILLYCLFGRRGRTRPLNFSMRMMNKKEA